MFHDVFHNYGDYLTNPPCNQDGRPEPFTRTIDIYTDANGTMNSSGASECHDHSCWTTDGGIDAGTFMYGDQLVHWTGSFTGAATDENGCWSILSAQLREITRRRTMTINISQTIVQMVATEKTAGEIMGRSVVEMIIAVRMEWPATLSIYRQ